MQMRYETLPASASWASDIPSNSPLAGFSSATKPTTALKTWHLRVDIDLANLIFCAYDIRHDVDRIFQMRLWSDDQCVPDYIMPLL